MRRRHALLVSVCLVLAIAATFALRSTRGGGGDAAEGTHGASLPRLVDLGSDQCVPCRLMAPILEELDREYEDLFEVQVIDVREDRAAAARYGIRVIPTQIFYDGSGRELFRHEGFLSKEAILAKWRELGIEVGDGGVPPAEA